MRMRFATFPYRLLTLGAFSRRAHNTLVINVKYVLKKWGVSLSIVLKWSSSKYVVNVVMKLCLAQETENYNYNYLHQQMHNYFFIKTYTTPTCFDLTGHHQGIYRRGVCFNKEIVVHLLV
jgi:hypothetical protein